MSAAADKCPACGSDLPAARGDTCPVCGAAVEAKLPPKKVKLKKKVAAEIARLNAEVWLADQIRLPAVAAPLAELEEAAALKILERFELAAENIQDPSTWIKTKAKATAKKISAQVEKIESEWKEWEEKDRRAAEERYGPIPDAVVDMILKLNRSSKIPEGMRLTRVAGPLTMVGEACALELLSQLEKQLDEKATEIEDPCWWLQEAAHKRTFGAMHKVNSMNRGKAGSMDPLSPIVADKVREPLSLLPWSVSSALLQELEEQLGDVKDPTSWIIEAAEAKIPPIAKRVQWIQANVEFAPDSRPLELTWALDVLAPLPERRALDILCNLQNRAGKIRNPMAWIRGQAASDKSGKGGGKGKSKKGGKRHEGKDFLGKSGEPPSKVLKTQHLKEDIAEAPAGGGGAVVEDADEAAEAAEGEVMEAEKEELEDDQGALLDDGEDFLEA